MQSPIAVTTKMLQGHNPQIPPSPARLGLPTTVHSPSLSGNPVVSNPASGNPGLKLPPSSVSSSSAVAGGHASPAAASSSALLSLLPPLPRAQAIIPQMASLATKLFDVSPHRAAWLASYRGNFPSFHPASSSSTAASSGTASTGTAKDTLARFTSLQNQLFEAVAELQEILDLKDSHVKIASEVRSRDSTLLAFTKKLREAEQVLDQLVDDYAEYRRDPKRPKKAQDQNESDYHASLHSSLDLDEVLSYAHRISYTTFAPPEHGAGLAPLRGALPPAPQDNEMRASQLYHFADLDVGVPKKAALETKDGAAAAVAVSEILLEPTPPREEVPALPFTTPHFPINVPPGWRKGMPVELELPPVPAGWKPGDPIPLPPDGFVFGKKGEDQQVVGAPRMPVVLPKAQAPEVTYVAPVNLDIPDDDDYSTEESSDVGSSEEDED